MTEKNSADQIDALQPLGERIRIPPKTELLHSNNHARDLPAGKSQNREKD
jgi:hypothetical protein